ncbi:Protein of unknown function (DUF295 [Striga hermonthica]|uniref:KIB1-4 beta-propeller domain-containing protein n=1 Tax=Striga hermonthica TaxID=68872 RepID=A0A9N7RHP1_STRHE|nr:Protein of unknown function (DUF295 [Striga hermonthica]
MAFSLQMTCSSSSYSSSVLGRRKKGSSVRFPSYKISDSRSYPRSTLSFRLNSDSVRPMILSSTRPCFSSSSSSSSYSPVILSEPKSSSFSSSPYLMLPHVFEAGATTTMTYKFYSLAENKVVTLATEFPAGSDMMVLRGDKWTLLGDIRLSYYGLTWWNWRWEECSYTDCVYSFSEQQQCQVLFALPDCGEVECWDLRDPLSPRLIKTYEKEPQNPIEKLEPPGAEIFKEYVVIAGQDVLMVSQYGVHTSGHLRLSDGETNPDYNYMTVDFDVHRYDPDDLDHPKYVEGSSLGGWAIFVGLSSHGVALPAAEFPELKPNSIYFTDPTVLTQVEKCVCGGHDIGIFNYEDKTVSRCYYPSDVRKIFPGPMWFFPDSKLN